MKNKWNNAYRRTLKSPRHYIHSSWHQLLFLIPFLFRATQALSCCLVTWLREVRSAAKSLAGSQQWLGRNTDVVARRVLIQVPRRTRLHCELGFLILLPTSWWSCLNHLHHRLSPPSKPQSGLFSPLNCPLSHTHNDLGRLSNLRFALSLFRQWWQAPLPRIPYSESAHTADSFRTERWIF